MNARALQAQVDAFNAVTPAGSPVEYRSHPHAAPLRTRTRSEAMILSGHTAIVMVEGVNGCVALDAVKPFDPTGAT